MLKQLSKQQVIKMHSVLVEVSGGTDGVRDDGLLSSALAAPFQTFGGVPLCPSIQEQAVRLCYGIAKNHPFVDGNKRTAVHTMLVFLALNGVKLSYRDDELLEAIVGLANGSMDVDDYLKWVLVHQR